MSDLSQLVQIGRIIEVRVTPRASRARIAVEEGQVRLYVTEPPENGKATDAARSLLARALGIAPTRLELIRGRVARNKAFRIAGP